MGYKLSWLEKKGRVKSQWKYLMNPKEKKRGGGPLIRTPSMVGLIDEAKLFLLFWSIHVSLSLFDILIVLIYFSWDQILRVWDGTFLNLSAHGGFGHYEHARNTNLLKKKEERKTKKKQNKKEYINKPINPSLLEECSYINRMRKVESKSKNWKNESALLPQKLYTCDCYFIWAY